MLGAFTGSFTGCYPNYSVDVSGIREPGCLMNYSVDVPPFRVSEDRMIVPRVRIQAIGMFESREGVGTDGGGCRGEGLKTCG